MSVSDARRALIVFCKQPVPGRVKTRLVPPLRDAEAAALAEAFLGDACDTYRMIPNLDIVVYVAPDGNLPQVAAVVGAVKGVWPQHGAELGARMAAAFEEVLADGYACAAIVGSDHPTLPPRHVEILLEAVERGAGDVAIGASDDGGYYGLALTHPHPELFDAMTFSHARVYADTLTLARAAGLDVIEGEAWYDVDDFPALRRLAFDLSEPPAPGAPVTRRTRAVLDLLRRGPAGALLP